MSLTRRALAAAGAAVAAAALPRRASARRSPGERVFIAAGWIPGADARGLYSAPFDAEKGVIGQPQMQADIPNPLYASFSPDGRFLYAGMSTVAPGQTCLVSAFAVEGLKLRPLAAADAGGIGSRDPQETPDKRHLLHVNYETGEVVCSRLRRDGSIGPMTSVLREEGSGPGGRRQTKAHPHSVRLAPGGRFVVVADLGADRHFVYRFDPRPGLLQVHGSAAVPPGSGPRHMEWHPGGRWLYSTNELAGGLNVLSWRAADGRLERIDTVATTPPGYMGTNTTSDLAVHPTGRFLYVSNRGHSSLAVFAIDPATGELTLKANAPAPDAYCWAMQMHPTGRWLLVSCRIAGAVAVLPIDRATGLPGAETSRVTLANPAAIRFV